MIIQFRPLLPPYNVLPDWMEWATWGNYKNEKRALQALKALSGKHSIYFKYRIKP